MSNLIVRINNKTDIVKNKICTSYFIDYSSEYKNSIFLAGTGRSGTTWVSNIINYNNQYRYIFEPFEPQNIEHYIPLKQFAQGDIHIMFYESLCMNPQEELKKLLAYLEKKYEQRIFAKFKTASQLSRKNSAVNMGNDLINSWKNYVTTEQIQKANDIVSIFGLNRIYAQNSVPNYENLYEFMES